MSAALELPTYEDLQTLLHAALARVRELEGELAARPKPRAVRKPVGDACQFCGDVKTEKQLFLGLPMCKGDNYEWTKCASRMRRAKGVPGYAWDRAYTVKQNHETGMWVARLLGETIGIGPERGAVRRMAYDHRTAAMAVAKAA